MLLYLFFLLILGLPIIVMEFAVGRGSQKSIAKSFNELEPKGSKWHIYRYFGIAASDVYKRQDVLYDNRRLDACIFRKDGKRRFRRS